MSAVVLISSVLCIFTAAIAYAQNEPARIDMCPHISKPRGTSVNRVPMCSIKGKTIELSNSSLRCRFTADDHLSFASLYNEYAKTEMVRDSSKNNLFMVEINGKRYSGSRDFQCETVKSIGKGFIAELSLRDPRLHATLKVLMEKEGLRMGLNVVNAGQNSVDFKVAFPHLSGLAISNKPSEDYYFFPCSGGIIADTPTVVRKSYGDSFAMYQVMDIFSPESGAGLYIRADDTDGRQKMLALRKYVPGEEETVDEYLYGTATTEEYQWTNSLEPVEGIGFTYEYLRRTRKPGESFRPADAVLSAHAGDWHAAMKSYADWAHKVWKFRPYPSKLGDIYGMACPGWGIKAALVDKDKNYRTDWIRQGEQCAELMSWWEWSPLGPWRTPWDKLEEKIGSELYKSSSFYWGPDPVTGKIMFTVNRGDYDGYNERWGGLAAFRDAVQKYRKLGLLVTLYTDFMLADDNTKVGQSHGKEWGIVSPDGSHYTNNVAWNMCPEVEGWRRYIADTMKRVVRETGVDGIRLDECGRPGIACFSTLHTHTFGERGADEWGRASAELTKGVRVAMDEVDPKLVLTAEFPGYDFMMQFMDGCITYDLWIGRSPLRPLECNLQRFYFPECKPFELTMNQDRADKDTNFARRFWNGIGSFENNYPANMLTILNENSDAYSSRDCEALIPTTAKYVYANRFTSGSKTIYTFFNSTGNDFDGTALKLKLKPSEHVFDLLDCRECTITRGNGNESSVCLKIPINDAACVIRLPARLSVNATPASIEVSTKLRDKNCRLSVCDRDGKELISMPAVDGVNLLQRSKITPGSKPACIKLLGSKLLLDIAPWPKEE